MFEDKSFKKLSQRQLNYLNSSKKAFDEDNFNYNNESL